MKKTYYEDFYGSTASITEYNDGTALLVTFAGFKRNSKRYNSVKGAKIALGKYSDCWKEVKRCN